MIRGLSRIWTGWNRHMTDTDTSSTGDIAIIGGGLNGAALALALAREGFAVTMFDAAPLDILVDEGFDGRATAIAAGSRTMLRSLGVWERIEDTTEPISDILVSDGRVSEGASPLFLHFDHKEVGTEPFGTLAENRHLRTALYDAVADHDGIDHRAPVKVMRVEYGTGWATLHLDDGSYHRARLAVACDGRRSRTAQAAGIRYTGWDYGQTGIVCTVEHERPHQGIAHEYFLPSGPFAILPLKGNRSSLVWTERHDIATAAMGLDDAGFGAEVARRFGAFLGDVQVIGPRWSYPLSLSLAHDYVKPRLTLVGDSAHGVHPIAGQGLNLGFKDSAALAEVLGEADRRGEDIGDLNVLRRYERWRRFDNTSMALGMDVLNRLFSNDVAPLRLVRDMGIAAVGKIGPLRRMFMRQAAGITPGLPKVMRENAR